MADVIVRIKNRPYMRAHLDHPHPERIPYLEFFLNKAEQLVEKNVLGRRTIVPPPYTLENTATGEVIHVRA